MSHDENPPTRKEIMELRINELKNNVEDEIDEIQLQLFEQRQKYLEESQGSVNMLNRRRHYKRDREALRQDTCDFTMIISPMCQFMEVKYFEDVFACEEISTLETHYPYFQQRVVAAGKKGLSPLQKCVAAIRQLAYGSPADHYDEYLRVAETTVLECLNFFCQDIIQKFGGQYLRRPNAVDIQRLLQMHEERHGFPGMLGSLDCMHWEWKNCHVAWKGQFTRGDHGSPIIILEVVASVDLWIWH
ncbi:hypothetical protein OSB04_031638 [Centaurea solstitialis]|uniref:Uncharacterized protein n=1 Tax=Centaurea solstitialis TaxID=347529 RepID=A0AA38S9X2_9ASTR|nr:hypothetical protein OSB04_031638 [Centaurea solstitialis]